MSETSFKLTHYQISTTITYLVGDLHPFLSYRTLLQDCHYSPPLFRFSRFFRWCSLRTERGSFDFCNSSRRSENDPETGANRASNFASLFSNSATLSSRFMSVTLLVGLFCLLRPAVCYFLFYFPIPGLEDFRQIFPTGQYKSPSSRRGSGCVILKWSVTIIQR